MYLVVHHAWLGEMSTARQAVDVLLGMTAAKDVPPLLALAARRRRLCISSSRGSSGNVRRRSPTR
jgi:hypothetical protein